MGNIPLLEFDSDQTALIEPSKPKDATLPEHCIIVFYNSVIQRLKQEQLLEKTYEIKSVLQNIEVFNLKQDDRLLAVVCPTGCGAPLAGSLLEILIALGGRRFVACGGAGVLKSELNRGAVVVPNAAIRDEGMSYHYLPPSRIVEADSEVVQRLVQVLQKHGVNYEVGKTWTTDAYYRETKGKIAQRKRDGCLTVEMECSALLAIAKFRNVVLGQYLLAGDDCGGTAWDQRLQDDLLSAPLKMFWLSVEACLTL